MGRSDHPQLRRSRARRRRRHGRGVPRARDNVLGREALKLLPADVSKDPERLKRLEREARMLAALNHPNIATLYGLEQHDSQPFLVMETIGNIRAVSRLA